MMRICVGLVLLAGVAAALVFARSEKPYPYPVAYKFGFDYREESVKEDGWQTQFRAMHPGAGEEQVVSSVPVVKLARFWPRFADTEGGARQSWEERQKIAPLPYLDAKTLKARQPTAAERKIEQDGWIAGYMASVRQHPANGQ
jgi:hypothetical protein